ncbi:MAG: oxygen-independent coproporphyrinogen III oxidase [Deltaproteobacteria bacterium]|nr:oxygen-independent coproporphyrinogen III oxidase [Deltaproteobacteria bacterium]
MEQTLIFDPELIQRYDRAGPRYTSYPTAPQFHEGFNEAVYRQHAQASNTAGRPLSLYVHLPFCDTACYYCACNKVATKDRSRSGEYLEYLFHEIELQAPLFRRDRPVDQLHFGGGTPTFLSHDELRALMGELGRHFSLRRDGGAEYSIEIDPREVEPDTLQLLGSLGFNRLSVGVQDFDPVVQKAVNRIQSEAETLAAITAARGAGFKSVSVDLIYGLPFQSVRTFLETLERVLAIGPDRMAVFNYAHLPHQFKQQKRIRAEDIPAPEEKLRILGATIERLTSAGYVYIGMDHFARPGDELAVAQREGTLHRNFQGYSTHADCDLVGLGVTAIGKVGDTYSQNRRTLLEYYALVEADHIPVFRGLALDADDRLRRQVITQLICQFELDFAKIEAEHGIDFQSYFDTELSELRAMERDGLLHLKPGRIEVLPRGKLLIRNVCMTFDRYLRKGTEVRYSKVI